jgi:hypothetical protein
MSLLPDKIGRMISVKAEGKRDDVPKKLYDYAANIAAETAWLVKERFTWSWPPSSKSLR